jgi:AcrR family transcriptional regulator
VPSRVSDEVVFDAAMRAVAEFGYDRATTRRIAEAAGINEVTLFRRFGDKQRLLLAAIGSELQGFAPEAARPSGDLAADLTAVVEHYARIYARRGGLVLTLLLEASRNPAVAAALRAPVSVMRQLGDLITHYQRAGALVDEPPVEALYALVGPVLMHAIDQRVDGAAGPTPLAAGRVVRRFLAGHQHPTDGEQ